ncbi:MAG: hypothetical protein ACOCQW_06270, partial [Halanaerobiaceae bacterium]
MITVFLPGTTGVVAENIINFLNTNLVIIITAIYCSIIYHYIYKVKKLKSFIFIIVGVITVLTCLFMDRFIDGIIALIIPFLLTIKKNENDIIRFEDKLKKYTLEIRCQNV